MILRVITVYEINVFLCILRSNFLFFIMDAEEMYETPRDIRGQNKI